MKRKLKLLALLGTLLMFFILKADAQTAGKKVTLTVNRIALTTALNRVEQLSGYYKINYGYDELSGYTVSAVIKDKTAIEAVRILLEHVPYTASLDGRYIQIRKAPFMAQAHQTDSRKGVSGRIMDLDGEPLVGATVIVPGTQKMAATDANGDFFIPNVEPNEQIEISYIGKKTIRRKAGSKFLNVIVEDDNNMLNEVVSTGYQRLSRERATGAFDKVNQDMIEARPTADLSSALQGLVAGMQATEKEDGTVDFKIRGTSSLYADTSPLVVVDGFPIEGSFSSINPNDVETVTVLKDAAAASIWGARSANGVIVVTTKKGKSDGKLVVNGQAFWRMGTTPDLDYILAQADSRTNVDYEIKALRNGWNMGEYVPGGSSGLFSRLTEAQELYFNNKYNGLTEAEMNAGLDVLRNRSNRDQLKKYLMQQQMLQQYNVSLSGGTQKFNNYFSLMYEKNDESTVKRGYNKFMANYNASFKVNRHITLTASTTWQRRKQETSGVTVSEFANLQPYEMLLNDDGSYAYNSGGTGQFSFNRQEVAAANLSTWPYSDVNYNMLQEVRNRSYQTTYNDFRIQLGINAQIMKGLIYDMKYQYENNTSDYRYLEGEETNYVRTTIDFFSDYDTKTGNITKSYLPMGAILRSGKSRQGNDVFRNQLTYSNVFGGKHDITALAGIEMSQYRISSTTNPHLYGYNPETNSAPAPYYGTLSAIGNMYNYAFYNTYYLFSNFQTSFNDRTDRYLSYYLNAAYMFDDKYGVSVSSRWDGSNFVTKDASLRWSPMWSVGLKWNMHKENFMKDVKWINYLILRTTYGLNGNAEKSTSPQTLISTTQNSSTMTTTASITSYGNPTLRWETTKTTNIGIDFSFFNSVLSGKFDYYNRKSVDVIGTVNIPTVYGSSSQMFNNAAILNRGVEVELGGHFKVPSIGLNINSTVNYAYNKNEVTKLYYPNMYSYGYMYASDPSNGYFVQGRPIGAMYSYTFAGMEDGIPYVIGKNGEKQPMNNLSLHNSTYGSEEFLNYEGTTISPHTFGWSLQATWRGFNLYAHFTGKFGGVFRDPVASTPPLVGGGNTFVSKFISYYENSDGSNFPTWPNADDFYVYRWSRYVPCLSSLIENSSFIRFKELTLSYELPKSWMALVRLQGVKVFCQVRDLGLVWTANKNGYDPEFLPGTNKPATSITLGINVKL